MRAITVHSNYTTVEVMTITGYIIYSLENIRLRRIPDYCTAVLLLILAIELCMPHYVHVCLSMYLFLHICIYAWR